MLGDARGSEDSASAWAVQLQSGATSLARGYLTRSIENICRFDEGFNLTPKARLPGPRWWSSIGSEEFFKKALLSDTSD